MVFIASKLAWFLLRPSVLALLAGIAGLALRRRALVVACLAVYAVVLFTPAGMLALRPLEDRFARPAAPARVDGILVLGGAIDTTLTEARGLPALNWAAERMTEAVALARRYPDARVVFSGGSALLDPGRVSEADAARTLFDALGLPPERATYESASRNTFENAVLTQRLVRPEPGQTWLLVTSAAHMPRAVGIFRQAGWAMLPWPVGYKTAHGWVIWILAAFPERLDLLDTATHEYVGLLAYRLLGRTDALFPAPKPPAPSP